MIVEEEEAIKVLAESSRSHVSSTVDESSPSLSDNGIQPKPQKATQKTVSFDWDKPLKKVSKEDKPQTLNNSTVIVRVIKPDLPDNQDAHDAQIPKRKDRKNFYNNNNSNFKGNNSAKKNQPKTQDPKNTNPKNLPKPQTQSKPEAKPVEETKQEIIEEPLAILVIGRIPLLSRNQSITPPGRSPQASNSHKDRP